MDKYMAKPDKTIEQHTKEVLEALELLWKYGYIAEERIYRLTQSACDCHDKGKVNKEFQKRVTSAKKLTFDPQKEVPHNVLSSYFLNRQDFNNEEEFYEVLFAIMYHHNFGDPMEYIQEKKELIKELLLDFEHYNIKRSDMYNISDICKNADVCWIKGLLHKCDYSASAGYQIEYKNDYLKNSLEELLNRWKKDDPDAKWNELQLFCMEHCNENIIIKAETGMGKTEAGLHWIGNQKGFFILPLRTAINAIYDRVKNDLLHNENVTERVGILHSESLDYYLKNNKEEKEEESENEKIFQYEKRGKNLSLPLSISTLDQLFDFTLLYPAYEMKLVTLAYSKVVIDEIQMYDPELLAYLIHGIQMIHKMGGKIAILTATFPPFIKQLMNPISFIEAEFTKENDRHNVKVWEKKLEETDIYEQYLKNESKGTSNKILVVCNTIKTAQKLYQALDERAELNGNMHILHSQFIKKDRQELEKEILNFGKTWDEAKEIHCASGIWVATSLVEASLDIDFDYLYTELKDLSSLFQRMGRCNRKGKKEISSANCFVYSVIDEKDLSTSGHGFIDKNVFDLSKQALKEVSGILSEKKKMELMETYFNYDNLKNSDYLRTYESRKDYLESLTLYKTDKEDIKLRNILSEEVIPHPILDKYGEEIRELERELSNPYLPKHKRREYSDRIRQYTVSIPLYMVKNYEKALRDNSACSYGSIRMDSYHKIIIIECIYDEMGFQKMDYKNTIRDANML